MALVLLVHVKFISKHSSSKYLIHFISFYSIALHCAFEFSVLCIVCVHCAFVLFCLIFIAFFHRNQNANIDFNRKKRTIQRLKRGVLPQSPKTVAEILAAFDKSAVFDTYGKSLHEGEDLPFFNGAIETKDFSYCVFSSRKSIELIEKYIPVPERHILMDGTFRIVPVGPFKQLLILYIRNQKKVFKCIS